MVDNNSSINSKSQQKTLTAVEAFNAFLEKFVQGKSYVLNDEKSGLFIKDNLEKTYTEYCNNSQEVIDGKFSDLSFQKVTDAIKDRDDVKRETMIDIINHAVWLWALPNDKKAPWVVMEPKTGKRGKCQEDNKTYKEDLRNIKGVAGGGQGYIQHKTNGVRFILYLFTRLVMNNNSIELLKCIIEKECSEKDQYPVNDKAEKVQDGVKNLFLHLCDSNKYEPIATTNDKKKIVRIFWRYLKEEIRPKNEREALEDLDNTIVKIKNLLSSGKKGFSFYDNSLPLLWKGESDSDLSLVQQLEYKKAMILYGPPGTSKTYTAKELAINIIFRDLMKNHKEDAIELLKLGSLKETLEGRVKRFQFHINLNYEDFVAGQTIKNNNVITRKGFIFDVVDQSAKKLKFSVEKKEIEIENVPYVVILDEINRTDISRVFGELFSAIENRGEAVDLMLKDTKGSNRNLQIIIPDNIYFIGTMNEIDFSLERVDFALRRRFIWEFHDYKEKTLKDIIDFKLNKAIEDNRINDSDNISNTDIEDFSKLCTKLNEKVEKELGEAYHIGHTFFAEIADIFVKLKENNSDNPWNKAKNILWRISIRPTLEAYCGTMEKEDKKRLLENPQKGNVNAGGFYNAFFTKEELNAIENDTATNGEE